MEYPVFLLFGAVLLAMYLGIRRQWASPGIVAGGGALGSIITMVLFMLARGTSVAHGLILGVLMGSLFAIATLSIAWYFQSNEMRTQAQHSGNAHPQPSSMETVPAGTEEYVDT